MSNNFGLGMMIQMLGGNESSVKAYQASLGKKISAIELNSEANGGDGALNISFTDGTVLSLYDCARSCCESRYMHTDDDLTHYVGGKFKGVELKDGGSKEPGEYGEVSETMFMHVKTTKGTFVVNTYNDHNGYYGGILIEAALNKLE